MKNVEHLVGLESVAAHAVPLEAQRRAGSSERIDDRQRIRGVIDALFRHGSRGLLRHADGETRISTIAFSHELNALSWSTGAAIPDAPFVIELVGLNSLFHMRLDHSFVSDDHLVTALPSSIVRLRRRWLRRAPVSSPVSVSFAQSGPPEIVSGRVRDLSYQGIAFEVDSPAAWLVPGAVIERLHVSGETGNGATIAAEVRSIVPALSGGCVYGLELLPLARNEARRYVQLVDDHLHPGTRTGSDWADHMWDLYTRCGYFNLSGKEPGDFHQRRRAFVSAAKQIDNTPQVGCHVVWPYADRAAGVGAALSALKMYSGTWLGFQMAKLKGDIDGTPSRKVLRELNLRVYEHIQRDPGVAWVMGYLQTKRAWSALVHLELPRRFVPTGEAAVVRFTALEIAVDLLWRLDDSVQVGAAAAAEVASLLRVIARMRPRAYCEALDLVPERVDLAANKRAWNNIRFERERAILVARRNGVAVAAAVAELGAEGTHVFGLQDLVRPYSIADGGEACFPHLLQEAKEWFRDRGKKRFVCFLEEGLTLSDAIREQMVNLGDADMTLLAAHRVPELLEHLYEVTAPRSSG